MKSLKFLLITFLLVSCGVKVNYDYEKVTNFKTYKSYNYFGDMKTGLSELDTKRLIRAIDAKLETMGLKRSENPDFFIDIKSENLQNRNNSNVGVGVGGGRGGLGGGLSVGIPIGQNKATREISIEFVDDAKTGMFWQAIIESSYTDNATPKKREQQFKTIVEKVFSSYPPKTE
ncbi:DUF4136 domain-containing protein [Winogradskyella undariae]|uniref:DUF4136 domain-containing protein n=1 Tax=Winogradskyella undariae TaxID=1285465 RepID=UPI0015CC9C07|nr:DUF4136 domain-containing protein [Winogradskyella undariae]QNK76204.1 DUF4136 domain-containing protein [Winogradskyella sp. PAMC22761]